MLQTVQTKKMAKTSDWQTAKTVLSQPCWNENKSDGQQTNLHRKELSKQSNDLKSNSKPPNNIAFDSLNNLPFNNSNDWKWISDILNPEYSTYGTTLGSPLHDLYSDDLCPDDLCLDDLCPDDLCYDDLCPNDRYINFETSKRKPSLRLNTAFL